MAAQGIRRENITPLDRLAYLGSRGMGALEFKPELKTGDARPSAIEMGELIETARRALSFELRAGNDPVWNNTKTASEEKEANELAELIAVGTSAGGARAKAVVGYNEKTDTFLSGQFNLPADFEHWLIKFDVESTQKLGASRDYGRIEYAYYLMARACGIEMAPSRLYEAGGRAHFMTKRFDRNPSSAQPAMNNGKLHQQTLCGLAQLDFRQRDAHDYNQLFMAVADLDLGYAAIDQVFLRMVFNVCLANNDDHTKNHSFLMDPDGTWQLSPAYDLTHAYRKDSLWVSRHLMSINGRFENITRDDLLQVARRFQVAEAHALIDKVLEVANHWPDFAQQAGVSQDSTQRIAFDIKELARAT
jgi:serine/threonine-protein kinase HipA